jgi:hypothetical protein
VPTLNPYTFPLVPYPGLAPELATRSGMGGWEPYVLEAPNDRLLPFVLSRRRLPSNPSWVSCAWLEHADTGARIATLVPTGAQAAPATIPTLGLLFNKLTDLPNQTEHFTYDGALIPELSVPCGVPLRLIVDNAWQSPRFYALAPAASLSISHLPLEWYHDGPLSGVPYGRGFRQRFYVDNGSLQNLDPREVETTNKDLDTDAEVTISLNQFAQKAFALPAVPAYLSQALSAARLPRYFLADGEAWRLLSVKSSPSGQDGGRWSIAATLESKEPSLSRGCKADALPVVNYDPDFVPRGWRCGVTSDTAPDFQPTGVYSCQLSAGVATGYVLETYRDFNPYSPTSNQQEQRLSTAQDLVRCPIPQLFQSDEQVLYATKNNCGPGFTGSQEPLVVAAGAYTSSLSKADANAQALAYAQANVQAHANSVGTCQASSNYMATYNANSCFSGFMRNVNDASDVRDATADEYSLYRTQNTGSDGQECPSYN